MKKSILALAAIFGMSLGMAVSLQAKSEKLDCDELAELSEALDTISDAVDNADPEELDEIDGRLGKVVSALRIIAKSEKDADLTSALNKLESAYKAKNQPAFVKAIDQVTDAIDAIEKDDC